MSDSRVSYSHLTGTGTCQVKAGECWLKSVFVNNVTTGLTLKLWDSLSATGDIVHDTITFTALGNYDMDNEHYETGLYATLGGTGSITFRILEA
jgi:hypothetical protein